MMYVKKKRILQTIAPAAVCALIIVSVNASVYAAPSTDELESTTSTLQGELNTLNRELSALSSDLESIAKNIEETTVAMAETQARMDEAQKKGEEQYEAMKRRIKYMYEAGDTSFIELLCSAESMADFLNKTDFVKNVSEYDRDMLKELENTQDEIRQEGETLEEQQAELQSMQQELSSKRSLLESKISSTSSELSLYSGQLARARAAEALAAQQAQNAAASEGSTGAAENTNTSAGSNTSSGSNASAGTGSAATDTSSHAAASVPPTGASSDGKQSLGTFRITHYCSCYYCSGGWGTSTSSGTVPTAGRTIAVDPSVIPYGTRVIINGYVYVAEDSGGAIKGNKIEIFVSNHAEALAKGVYYAEVFLAD